MKNCEIYNWTGYPRIQANLYSFSKISELQEILSQVPMLIARGAGLSYGDASLSDEIISTVKFNKLLSFDKSAGIIRCESGATLDELLQVIVPAGWFLPVTPGTKFITVGGAVAADVHGKNHHKEGSFTQYVTSITLIGPDGNIALCNAQTNPELFHVTCGGMGLTGLILEVEFQLKKIETSMIHQKNIIVRNLDEMLNRLEENHQSTYSVAWLDCLSRGQTMGRGVVMLGEHARLEQLSSKQKKHSLRLHKKSSFRIPFMMPSALLNSITSGWFNSLYFHSRKIRTKDFLSHYDTFFYPLDFIQQWNRLYGKAGFLQYQFVVPLDRGKQAMHMILKKISDSNLASFLGVLKIMSDTEHTLSFGMLGYTLALDFPLAPKLFPLLEELDRLVADHGGKVYLAKDARMKQPLFDVFYPRAAEVRTHLNKFTGVSKFQSHLSQRLSIVS